MILPKFFLSNMIWEWGDRIQLFFTVVNPIQYKISSCSSIWRRMLFTRWWRQKTSDEADMPCRGSKKVLAHFSYFLNIPRGKWLQLSSQFQKKKKVAKKVLLIDSFIALFTSMPFSNNKCCVHERFLHTHRVINGAASVCIPLGGDALI